MSSAEGAATPRTVLITGSTDGIGLATAELLAAAGHRLLLHGRDPERLRRAERRVASQAPGAVVRGLVADLSRLAEVERLAAAILEATPQLDVVINNAGVLRAAEPIVEDGLDVRFVVNAIAPYLLTRRLLPSLSRGGRVVNLSSAAQAPVDLTALAGQSRIEEDMAAYAQSKLALTMWSRHLGLELGEDGPVVVAVNPGSLLGTKMVAEGFGVAGKDVSIGADILARAACSEQFAGAHGAYFDNDTERFARPHPDALDPARTAALVAVLDSIVARVRPHRPGPGARTDG